MRSFRTLNMPGVLAEFSRQTSAICSGEYTLEDGTQVQGQSFSHTQACLRDAGWRGVSNYSALKDALDLAGFRVVRGRGKRVYHGGVYKLGVPCDVVTIKV